MILSSAQKFRYSMFGVGLVLFVVAIAVLSILQFQRAFDSTVPIRLESGRAGLLMTSGSEVKLRGVTVGYVDDVTASGDGATIELGLDPDQLARVPADVTARIIPPTIFGTKYVELVPRNDDTTFQAMRADSTISASHVTVEINTAFQHLMELLDAAQPAKVNAALSALSQALDGNGERLGSLITQLDSYLTQINPALGNLRTVLPRAKSVLGTYDNVTPALLDTTDNLSTTSGTIQRNATSLDAFLLSLTSVSRTTSKFLDVNDRPLASLLDVLQTPLRSLARYSPEFPCLFKSVADIATPAVGKLIGGGDVPGIQMLARFFAPEKPYDYSRDLPEIRADVGPRCYNIDDPLPRDAKIREFNFDVGGATPYRDNPTKGFSFPILAKLLFGELSEVTR